MVCPYCVSDTQVVNSRTQKRSNQIWRRRRCLNCKATFTTHEMIYLPAVFSVKSGVKQLPFEPGRILAELVLTLRDKNRPYEAASELTATITQKLIKNASNGLILAQDISAATASVLKNYDNQAYLRFVAEHPSLAATSLSRRRGRS